MIYPLLSLYDGTEFTYTDLQDDGKIIVYVETPHAIDGFHSLECVLPDYEVRNVQGYSVQKQKEILEHNANITRELLKDEKKRLLNEMLPKKYSISNLQIYPLGIEVILAKKGE